VDHTSQEISGNTKIVMVEVEQVGNITTSVKEESDQIVGNMERITERMKKVEEASTQIEKGSESLNEFLTKFKTVDDHL